MSMMRNAPDLSRAPIFCAHEHWGSIDSVGTSTEGFRADTEAGAMPARRTGLFDIVLDPYFRGFLSSSGVEVEALAEPYDASFPELAQAAPAKAWEALGPAVRLHQLTGAFQCIRRGILSLHGIDLAEAASSAITAADASIARAYGCIFDWHREAMSMSHLSVLVRPVHPEFYTREQSPESAHKERSFTRTVMRIDPLLDLWPSRCPRREGLSEIAGIEPADPSSWREFLDRLFGLAVRDGALGIKQLQAYSRPLDFRPREDSEVLFRGDLTVEQVQAFQDWVVHECCKRADDLGWPHQVHVGTHNIRQSSPMPLETLAARYPRMKLVLIHCWPFVDQAGWLAKLLPNVYLDTCWLPVLNPEFYRDAMRTWLGFVPLHKLMCSQDSTSVEMAVGSSMFVREILSEALVEHTAHLGTSRFELERVGGEILDGNAREVYRVSR